MRSRARIRRPGRTRGQSTGFMIAKEVRAPSHNFLRDHGQAPRSAPQPRGQACQQDLDWQVAHDRKPPGQQPDRLDPIAGRRAVAEIAAGGAGHASRPEADRPAGERPARSPGRAAVAGAILGPAQAAAAPVLAGVEAARRLIARPVAMWALAATGLLAYNWWILVPLKPGLMRSPDELFSNMELTGQPYAGAMQHADLLAGLLLLGAFLMAGSKSLPGGRPEWAGLMIFAAGGALGGLFPELCGDEVSASCRNMEWAFQLPLQQYLHIGAGIAEFGGISIAVLLAARRTSQELSAPARIYRYLARALYACYPLLGLAYLTDRLGGVMEAVFFIAFTLIVVTALAERAGTPGVTQDG